MELTYNRNINYGLTITRELTQTDGMTEIPRINFLYEEHNLFEHFASFPVEAANRTEYLAKKFVKRRKLKFRPWYESEIHNYIKYGNKVDILEAYEKHLENIKYERYDTKRQNTIHTIGKNYIFMDISTNENVDFSMEEMQKFLPSFLENVEELLIRCFLKNNYKGVIYFYNYLTDHEKLKILNETALNDRKIFRKIFDEKFKDNLSNTAYMLSKVDKLVKHHK